MYDKITSSDKINIELNMLHNKSKTINDGLFMMCLSGKATKEKDCAYAQNSVPIQ